MLCSLLCCCCSVTKSCPNLWDPMDCSTPGFSVHHHLPKFVQTHVHQVSDTTQPSQPLLPSSPLVLNLPQHQSLFQWISSLHQVTKVLELQLQHQSCQWIFISFRIDWFDFLAIQGTLKSLLNHHNSKTSILQCSAFFMVQLSHLYLTTVKTIALTMVPENPVNSMKRQIFPYYIVNTCCSICSNVFTFIPDIGNLYFLSFFFISYLEVYQFY